MEINQRREKWEVGARTHGVWGRKEKGSKKMNFKCNQMSGSGGATYNSFVKSLV